MPYRRIDFVLISTIVMPKCSPMSLGIRYIAKTGFCIPYYFVFGLLPPMCMMISAPGMPRMRDRVPNMVLAVDIFVSARFLVFDFHDISVVSQDS